MKGRGGAEGSAYGWELGAAGGGLGRLVQGWGGWPTVAEGGLELPVWVMCDLFIYGEGLVL
jgi:hypothetical protein